MTCWMACAVAASAGAPAAAVACAGDVVCAGTAPPEDRERPPDDSRVTATAMIATRASARIMVITIPPIAGLSLRGGLAVSNSGTLLGSVLLMRPQTIDQVSA